MRVLLGSPWAFVALGLGTGLSPVWPGTVGALLGVLLAWPLREFHPFIQAATVVAGFAVGVWACGRTGRDLGSPDHGAIVWDEVVSMVAVALAGPPGTMWWIAGFVAFRAFDILKPWPIDWIDRRFHNGLGVMLDDAAAAIYAVAAVAAAHYGVNALSP